MDLEWDDLKQMEREVNFDLNRELASQSNQKENMPIVQRSMIAENKDQGPSSQEISRDDGWYLCWYQLGTTKVRPI